MSIDQHSEADNMLENRYLITFTPRLIWRISCIAIGSLVLVGVVITYAYPRFTAYLKDRTLRQAEAYIELQDYRSAYLMLEALVRDDPTNFAARRRRAQILDESGSGQGLADWKFLVEYEPENAANHVGHATAALRAGQLEQLAKAVAQLQRLQPDGVDYHRLAATLAKAKGDPVTMRQQIVALARVDPDNSTTQFNLTILKLNSTDPAEVAKARETLEKFARGDQFRIRATLALINDAEQQWPDEKDPNKRYALLAQKLKAAAPRLRAPGSFMLMGGVEQRQPAFQDLVEHMKNQPAPTPEDAVTLNRWIISIGQKREALLWLEELVEKTRQDPAVLGARATNAILLDAWPKLEQLLLQGAWGQVSTDIITSAFQSHQLRLAGNEAQAESRWGLAVQYAQNSTASLRLLYRLAQTWHWANKQAPLLWLLVGQSPGDVIAWRQLAGLAMAARDTAQVWRVYCDWVRATPADTQVQAERVVLGLLARPQEPGLVEQAEKVFQQQPHVPACRMAKVLALWRAGRPSEALAVFEAGKFGNMTEPRIALVHGLVLASMGRRDQSLIALAKVPMEFLLPEEVVLMSAAQANRL
jgi:tetratricopeptide (TPR) repeat protein